MGKVLHIDIDAFFASVEIKENPELRKKRVVIVGAGKRGVVTSAGYNARELGVKAGLPYKKALAICPDCIFLSARHKLYERYSKRFFNILRRFSPDIEIYSIDEVFIDISKLNFLRANDIDFAETLKFTVKKELGLDVTIGIGDKKVSAKIATEFAKPAGICRIIDEDSFLENIEISKFPGIGKAMTPRFYNMGIRIGRDIKKRDFLLWEKIKHNFGTSVLSYERQQLKKIPFLSVSRGLTFEEDINDINRILYYLANFSEEISEELVKYKVKTKRVGVRLRYYDFEDIEKRTGVYPPVFSYYDLFKIVKQLFYDIYGKRKGKIRAVSVMAMNIVYSQYMFFNNPQKKREKAYRAIVEINSKMGKGKIIPLRLFDD
jgi:DNA polymerase-4